MSVPLLENLKPWKIPDSIFFSISLIKPLCIICFSCQVFGNSLLNSDKKQSEQHYVNPANVKYPLNPYPFQKHREEKQNETK